MNNKEIRSSVRMEAVVKKYGDMLFRLCLITLGNIGDAEDAVQETMISYLQRSPEFENEEHEKAWLLKVAANKCKDILRYRIRHPVVDMEAIKGFTKEPDDSGIIEALMTLPGRFRIVLILYYVEEYSVREIASIIGRSTSAVKMRLQKGRRLLKEVYGKEYR